MELIYTKKFISSLKKLLRKQPGLTERVEDVLVLLSENPKNPLLGSHKLKGELSDAWACKIDYSIRLVFSYEKNPHTDIEEILLIKIGSHDEVY